MTSPAAEPPRGVPDFDSLLEALRGAQQIGAIGPGPIEGHVDHALGFLAGLGEGLESRRVLDLGSGGGLPGLVLAVAEPRLLLTLLDGRTERAHRLAEVVRQLDLGSRVEVLASRAEVAAHGPLRFAFDAVVARGFASPAVTAECAAAFVHVDGKIVVSEPPDALATRTRWPSASLSELNLAVERVLTSPYAYVVLRATSPCPDRYPRRVGVPAKRPLY